MIGRVRTPTVIDKDARIRELEDDVRELRRQLALEADHEIARAFCQRLGLSPTPATFLALLYQRAECVVTIDALMCGLYEDRDEPDTKVLDVYVSKLRKRLGHAAIDTARAEGFRLTALGADACDAALEGETPPLIARPRLVGVVDDVLGACLTGDRTLAELVASTGLERPTVRATIDHCKASFWLIVAGRRHGSNGMRTAYRLTAAGKARAARRRSQGPRALRSRG